MNSEALNNLSTHEVNASAGNAAALIAYVDQVVAALEAPPEVREPLMARLIGAVKGHVIRPREANAAGPPSATTDSLPETSESFCARILAVEALSVVAVTPLIQALARLEDNGLPDIEPSGLLFTFPNALKKALLDAYQPDLKTILLAHLKYPRFEEHRQLARGSSRPIPHGRVAWNRLSDEDLRGMLDPFVQWFHNWMGERQFLRAWRYLETDRSKDEADRMLREWMHEIVFFEAMQEYLGGAPVRVSGSLRKEDRLDEALAETQGTREGPSDRLSDAVLAAIVDCVSQLDTQQQITWLLGNYPNTRLCDAFLNTNESMKEELATSNRTAEEIGSLLERWCTDKEQGALRKQHDVDCDRLKADCIAFLLGGKVSISGVNSNFYRASRRVVDCMKAKYPQGLT